MRLKIDNDPIKEIDEVPKMTPKWIDENNN